MRSQDWRPESIGRPSSSDTLWEILLGGTHSEARESEASMVGYESDKAAILKRLARVEGQVRGIARMVDEDRYCIDVLQQVSAATNALQKILVRS